MKLEEISNTKMLVPIKPIKKRKNKKKKIVKIIFLIFVCAIFLKCLAALKKQNDKENFLNNLNFMGIEIEKEIGKDLMEIDYIDNLICSITYPEIGTEEIDSLIREIITNLKNNFILMYRSNDDNKEHYFQYIIYETYLAPENKFSLILNEVQIVNESNVISEKVYIYVFDLATGKIINNSDIFIDGYAKEITNILTELFESDEYYKNNVYNEYKAILKDSDYKIAITNESILIYFDKYEIMPGNFGIVKIELPYDDINDFLLINKEDKLIPPMQEESGDAIENNDDLISGDSNTENIRYAISEVNVRAEQSVYSKKLGVLQEGEKITIIEEGKDWTKVYYNEAEAYIKAEYLSKTKVNHNIIEFNIKDRGIDPTKPMVALTYDDGPNPKSTPRILDTLEQYGVVATFFDLGQLVNTYPDIVRREEESDCEVGNHTYSHVNLNILTEEELQLEIQKSEAAFENALGHKTTLFRPAYGNTNATVKQIVEYPLITWNVDSLDWKTRNKNKILAEIRKTKDLDGKIILMHSIYESTADATEVLVPELLEQGYQLVTISELAYYKGKTLETGKVYTGF